MKDILAAITACRTERGRTEYPLAERFGLPQSTISSRYRKNMPPTVASLEKICAAFGITLSQLFAEGSEPVAPTESQRLLPERRFRLSPVWEAAVFALIDKMQRKSRRCGHPGMPAPAVLDFPDPAFAPPERPAGNGACILSCILVK